MIVLAILATIAAPLITLFVGYANGMSSNPSAPFQGKGIIALTWLIAAVLWLAWLVG